MVGPIATLNRMPLLARLVVVGALGFGLVGGIVGLIVGLTAYPPTAGFAVFELGLPSAAVGAVLGLIVGAIAEEVQLRRRR